MRRSFIRSFVAVLLGGSCSVAVAHTAGTPAPMSWVSVPGWALTPLLPAVGLSGTNFFGVCDLHGLVWEWVADFNTTMVTGDARGDTGLDRQLFCAGGSQNAKDRNNFPAYMRYGFRSSLKASYTVHNL